MIFDEKIRLTYQFNKSLENLGTPTFINTVSSVLNEESKQFIAEHDFNLRIYARVLHDAMKFETPDEINAYFMKNIQDQNYVISLKREFGEL